jgi:tripartite-type tricarboxylate transporter receptor subunit TctC
VHIPFRGGAPAMTALLGGQMYFGNAADIIPSWKAARPASSALPPTSG